MTTFTSQLQQLQDQPLSVTEAVGMLNSILQPLQLSVRGEITSISNRGHYYFTINDPTSKASLSCIAWQSIVRKLSFDLQAGMEITVTGRFNLYAPSGRLSFIVERAAPVGEGALKEAFARLKAELEAAGLFEQSRKRQLPSYPQTIGLITSLQGDALKDFQTHLSPVGIKIWHRDVRVEGTQAVDTIVAAIAAFNRDPKKVELIVITRGGGSLESLQAFNSREVAEAIAASRIPVLSAVGHEDDNTIADLVADVRASTPTDAAKIVSFHWLDAPALLNKYRLEILQAASAIWHRLSSRLQRATTTISASLHQHLTSIHQYLSIWPHRTMAKVNTRLNTYQEQLFRYSRHWPSVTKQLLLGSLQKISGFEAVFFLADPNVKLKQGYSICRDETGQLITSVTQTTVGARLILQLADGSILNKVTAIES